MRRAYAWYWVGPPGPAGRPREDLAQALGTPYFATADGIGVTAAILDDLLARRTTGRRPAALADDMDWILAASGRAESDDNRLPLIG